MLHILIPGEPQSLARPRAFIRSGKRIGMMDPCKNHKWQLKQFFLHALTNYCDGDNKISREHFLTGSYDVVIRLYCSYPNLPKGDSNRLSWGLLDKTTKIDVDNAAKLILDAGNKTLWDDDAEIVSLYVKKYFCQDGKPRTEIWVMPRKKKANAEKVLSEVHMDQVEEFCHSVGFLAHMLDKYRCAIKSDYDPDELYASSIAYHLTKIIDEHGAMLKKLDKYRKLWHEISVDEPVTAKGKTLC